jgi:dynein heavy chain
LDLLETKRNKFPRFYFLSNDDLFEVLGQSKDPFAINKHVNKFFPGIRRLDFTNLAPHAKTDNEKKWAVTDIFSPDGEKVTLKEP